MFLKGRKKRANGSEATASTTPGSVRPAEEMRTMRTPPANPKKPAAPSIISADLRIEGDLISEGDIQVDGTVIGDIRTNTLTLGEGSSVKGAVKAESIRACGAVEGQLDAKTVLLTKTARVTGDIFHDSLAIEAGAFFHGQCRRHDMETPTRSEAVEDVANVASIERPGDKDSAVKSKDEPQAASSAAE